MKKLVIVALIGIGMLSCKGKVDKTAETDVSSNAEKPKKEMTSDQEWKVLFDGTSFEHWKGYATTNVHSSWKLEDGAMVFYPQKTGKRM